MTGKSHFRLALMALAGLAAGGGTARAEAPSAAQSFAVGTSGLVCEADSAPLGAARGSLFDRKWQVLCRDVALPVGSAYALHGSDAHDAELARLRGDPLDCGALAAVQIEGVAEAERADCAAAGGTAPRTSYRARRGGILYVVEGLAAYDGALRLALASLVADRVVAGEVRAASLGGSDTAALARAAAALSDPATLIGQGYRRNAAGAYAEAAETFDAVTTAAAASGADPAELARLRHETTVNRALQQSNLGEFDQAAMLFAEARTKAGDDPLQSRLSRNFEAIDAINRGMLDEASAILARPQPPGVSAPPPEANVTAIDAAAAAGLNAGRPGELSGVLGQEVRLTLAERIALVDAQAEALGGTVARLRGDLGGAHSALVRAGQDVIAVRDGRVVSMTRQRSQILAELALVAEARHDDAEAERLLRAALALVEQQYPESGAVNAARARLAGFLARRGRSPEALAAYKDIATGLAASRGSLVGLDNLIEPYFELLIDQRAAHPELGDDLVLAAQLVERPGAADSLTLLSRQLEGGSGEAAELFRQSQAVARDLERGRITLAQAAAAAAAGQAPANLADLKAHQARLATAQLDLLARLGAFPQYRALAHTTLTAAELRAALGPGEAYLKLASVGGQLFAVWVGAEGIDGWRVGPSAADVAAKVAALRSSISETVNGVRQTYPYDIDTALGLGEALLGPAAARMSAVRHLVFEPDGALLALPPGLLTLDRAGVSAYHARADAADGDPFDMRGIAWIGRGRLVSTALSAASFAEARKAPVSHAGRFFLGLGENQTLGGLAMLPGESAPSPCDWPVAAWNQPVSAAEVRAAAVRFGPRQADLMTGAAFTDTALMARPDLADFKVIHFATHGLVSAPREGCPARPALLTSFGGAGSTGLLKFEAIFNLHLDADLVVLSACDTAGQASLAATREAGLTTGGGQALDGLVRAFIASGARQVIASHWPAPDDFDATRRLFDAFYAGGPGESGGAALLRAQTALMDQAETSHPFYWAGFALIGDGARALSAQ